MPKICDPVPAVSIEDWQGHLDERNLTLAEGVVQTGQKWDGRIDLLIGTQDLYAVLKESTIRLGDNLVVGIWLAITWRLAGRSINGFSSGLSR